MAFEEDMSVFFNVDEFAVSALFTPAGTAHPTEGVSVEIPVIIEDRYVGGSVDNVVKIIEGSAASFVSAGIDVNALVLDLKTNVDYKIMARDAEQSDDGITVWIVQ